MKTQLPEKIVQDNVWLGNPYLTELVKNHNQLITYLAELMEVVEKHEAQNKNLRGGWTEVWTEVEIKKAEFKWPQRGDIIYRLNSGGDIIEQRWYDTEKQRKCQAFVGIFKTREEAQKEREAIICRLIK